MQTPYDAREGSRGRNLDTLDPPLETHLVLIHSTVFPPAPPPLTPHDPVDAGTGITVTVTSCTAVVDIQFVDVSAIDPELGTVVYPHIPSPVSVVNVPALPQSHQPPLARFGQRPMAPSGSAACSQLMVAAAAVAVIKGGTVAMGAGESASVPVRVRGLGMDGGADATWILIVLAVCMRV